MAVHNGDMIERLPRPLRLVFDWQRRRFFREEAWRIEGSAESDAFVHTLKAAADNGLPLLLSLPKFTFNRAFVGRVRDGRVVLKHRTKPLIWPIGPGSYFFSGRFEPCPDGGITVAGDYRLRPTLAIMYYAYLTLGFAFLGISILAAVGGGAWAAIDAIGDGILLSGMKMLAVSTGYLSLGWLHITLEKWLDGRNRRAVLALLERAAGGNRAAGARVPVPEPGCGPQDLRNTSEKR